MNIIIGNAWVYANGSLHIGHLAALLPGDVLARYHRLKGDTVCFVSGSDCYGTPITLRAKNEKRSPLEISEKYHQSIQSAFEALNFSFDVYSKTTAEHHQTFVDEFHKQLYENKYVVEKTLPQVYCEHCDRYLPDRLVIGICPSCGEEARGDQCDACGSIYQPEELLDIRCFDCHHKPVFKTTNHLYIEISQLKDALTTFLQEHESHWRSNAVAFTKRYLEEGLKDRAITRDLDWGIKVPKEGYENKRLYIWVENVLGYLSTTALWCHRQNIDFKRFWNDQSKHYYVHGKDNIPFHTIILPALLIAHGEEFKLPDEIISSEYLTLEGKKISTSKNYALWLEDINERYHPDAIRYFLLSHNPERKDADFTWDEFLYANNSELLGIYGNFINRTLAFINKSFNHEVPHGSLDLDIKAKIEHTYEEVGSLVEKGKIKKGLRKVIDLARYANKYFDEKRPWATFTEDKISCENTLFNCVQIIVNLATLLEPFLPTSSERVYEWFKLSSTWRLQTIDSYYKVPEIEVLFERLVPSIVEEERKKLDCHQ